MLKLTKTLVIGVIFCGLTAAHGQYNPNYRPYYPPVPQTQNDYYPPIQQPRRNQSSDLSYKCARASQLIKNNDCGPQGCDIGYCIALQHGCRINNWGHSCSQTYR